MDSMNDRSSPKENSHSVFKWRTNCPSVGLRLGGEMPLHPKTVADRGVQKTQNPLRAALVSLIAEKPYDSIVVKEILDRANVGRSSFCMHFRDKDDLLASGMYES